MGFIKSEKERLEFEVEGYQSNLESWVSPIQRIGVPVLAIGGTLFLLYIAGRKILIKKREKSFFEKFVLRSPIQRRKKRRTSIAKKAIAISTPIALALVRTGLVAFVKRSINNGTTKSYSG